MKKLAITLVSLLCLVGCGSSSNINTSLKNGNDKVVTGDITVTRDEIYQGLLDDLGSYQIVSEALEYIASKEITDETAIQAKLDERIKSIEENSSSTIDEYAKNNGYDSKEAYIDDALRPDAMQSLLFKKYVTDHFDDIIKDYKVRYIKVITVDAESTALDIIKQSKDSATFDTFMDTYSGSDYGLVCKEDSVVDEKIIEKLDKFSKDGVYSKAIKDSTNKFAVVYVYNTDLKNVKDTTINSLTGKDVIQGDCEAYYLKKYKFDVFEPSIKDKIKDINENYFG